MSSEHDKTSYITKPLMGAIPACTQELNREDLWRRGGISSRRMVIGSRAPVCTFNECRGCRFKCTSEQVPVDANDPMNSAYHYRCVCHRWFKSQRVAYDNDSMGRGVCVCLWCFSLSMSPGSSWQPIRMLTTTLSFLSVFHQICLVSIF